ncbi:thiol-disulfide oxidoreductase DCC family protein [Streptomyces sp. HMX112]|uniref:thiol-disulfide oxidoreductase DCC family protein n=1 Tax=Streptomyces sp. HMX112 TaxID=3390850 RepID=UPI003A7F99AF
MTAQPVLLFDGDCGFCGTAVGLARRAVRPRAEIVPWQSADLAALGVTEERADREVLWIGRAGGPVHGGARAVAELLMSGRRRWRWLGLLLRTPPVCWVARGVYRIVADNRRRLPGGTALCALPARDRDTRTAP